MSVSTHKECNHEKENRHRGGHRRTCFEHGIRFRRLGQWRRRYRHPLRQGIAPADRAGRHPAKSRDRFRRHRHHGFRHGRSLFDPRQLCRQDRLSRPVHLPCRGVRHRREEGQRRTRRQGQRGVDRARQKRRFRHDSRRVRSAKRSPRRRRHPQPQGGRDRRQLGQGRRGRQTRHRLHRVCTHRLYGRQHAHRL